MCHKRDDVCDGCYISLTYILSQMLTDFREGAKLAKAFLRILHLTGSVGYWRIIARKDVAEPGLTAEFSCDILGLAILERWNAQWHWRRASALLHNYLSSHHRSWFDFIYIHIPKIYISTSCHFQAGEIIVTGEYECSLTLWQDVFDFLLNTEKYITSQIWVAT